MRVIFRLWNDCRAATSIEYGIITSLIAVTLIIGLGTVGHNLASVFGSVSDGLGGVVTPPASSPNDVRAGGGF